MRAAWRHSFVRHILSLWADSTLTSRDLPVALSLPSSSAISSLHFVAFHVHSLPPLPLHMLSSAFSCFFDFSFVVVCCNQQCVHRLCRCLRLNAIPNTNLRASYQHDHHIITAQLNTYRKRSLPLLFCSVPFVLFSTMIGSTDFLSFHFCLVCSFGFISFPLQSELHRTSKSAVDSCSNAHSFLSLVVALLQLLSQQSCMPCIALRCFSPCAIISTQSRV